MANPLRHWELMVGDVAEAKRFYGAVFGWQFEESKVTGYTSISTGEGVAGGMIAKPPTAPTSALNVYFQVEDVTQTLRAVVEAGGVVVVPKTAIPGVGWFAMFLDPDQIPVGIVETKMEGAR